MANALDMLGRALLRIGGMSPQQIRQQTRAMRAPKPMPRANTSAPRPSGPTQVRGQTNLFSQSGNPRNFRNPGQAANRAPTLSPVQTRGGSATPPNRPAGGFGRQSPGQMNLTNQPNRIGRPSLPPGQRGGGLSTQGGPLATQGRGPLGGQRSLPPGRPGGAVERSGPTIDVQARPPRSAPPIQHPNGSTDIRGRANSLPNRGGSRPAAQSRPAATGGGGLGRAFGILGSAAAVADQAGRVFNPNDNLLTSLGDLGNTISNGGRPGPGHSRYQEPITQGRPTSRFAGARDAAHARAQQIQGSPVVGPAAAAPPPPPRQPIPRSPAASAPIHSSPAQRAPQPAGSPYAPQAGQAPRPNTPVASPPAPQPSEPAMSRQYQGNDEPGRLGQAEGGYAGQPTQPAPTDANGFDMERRRAFLDADNSLDGIKAIKELLNRRKLSISVEN